MEEWQIELLKGQELCSFFFSGNDYETNTPWNPPKNISPTCPKIKGGQKPHDRPMLAAAVSPLSDQEETTWTLDLFKPLSEKDWLKDYHHPKVPGGICGGFQGV